MAQNKQTGQEAKERMATRNINTNDAPPTITLSKIDQLVRDIDPEKEICPCQAKIIMQMGEDFIDNVVKGACLIAKNRHATTVEARDVQFYLKQRHGMFVPGFGTEYLEPKKKTTTAGHKQKLELIRKQKKK